MQPHWHRWRNIRTGQLQVGAAIPSTGDLGLIGPVALVVTTYISVRGARVESEAFDESGMLITRRTRNTDGTEVEQHFTAADSLQGRTEVVQSTGNAVMWTGSWLNGMMFSIPRGTSTAKTFLSHKGWPINTIFTESGGRVLSEIRYETDDHGLVLRASQFEDLPGSDEHGMGDSIFSGEFEYTGGRRLSVTRAFFRGLLIMQSTFTYNDHGLLQSERSTEESGARRVVRFDYEYDSAGNWVNKRVHHAMGIDEISRHIEYFSNLK